MANENTQTITLQAAATTAIRVRRFVSQSSTGIAEVGTAGGDAVGISFGTTTATAGDPRAIAVMTNNGAKSEIEAGEALAVGDNVSSDNQGRAKTSASGEAILGTCVKAAAAAGEVAEIVFQPAGRQAT